MTALLAVGVALAVAAIGLAVSSVVAGGHRRAGHASVAAKALTGRTEPSPPSVPAGLARREVGGSQLASRGIVVDYGRLGRSRPSRPLPRVPASAYVIANAATGAVLAAKDPHGLFPPASTLKVLTAVALLPRLNPDALVLATRQAASVEPNIVGLIPGHRYRVADLFRALLLISANDAAVSLTQATGSFGAGMALINAEAQHLQAYDVVAKQPNGLPAPGQVASAYDLALIARQALALPAFMRYDSTLRASFLVRRHHSVELVNQNYLLTQYPGGIGGKIGWTMTAEATYIGLARRHGVTLIVTIMHATPLTEISSAEKLLNWGFAMDQRVCPVGELVPPLPAATATAGPGRTLPAHRDRRVHASSGTAAAAGQAAAGQPGRRFPLGYGVITGLWVCVLAGLVALRWQRRRRRA